MNYGEREEYGIKYARQRANWREGRTFNGEHRYRRNAVLARRRLFHASESELRIRCFAATGCLEHEENPPVEDDAKISPRSSHA